MDTKMDRTLDFLISVNLSKPFRHRWHSSPRSLDISHRISISVSNDIFHNIRDLIPFNINKFLRLPTNWPYSAFHGSLSNSQNQKERQLNSDDMVGGVSNSNARCLKSSHPTVNRRKFPYYSIACHSILFVTISGRGYFNSVSPL
jgi:hypothetical protein